MQGYHRSVLLGEAVDALNIRDAWYLDCTLGDGGHSIEILKRGGKVVGVDVDPQALQRVQKRFEDKGIDKSRFKLILGNFRDIKNLILRRASPAQDKYKQADTAGSKYTGAIFDLGVSSLQLETPGRGFSFGKEGPLDMRMDPSLAIRALDLLNVLTRKELYELFSNLGEEKYSRRLADALVRAREVEQVTGSSLQGTGLKTTKDLADLVERVYRKVGIRDLKIHPATRIFQALRIAVNDELGALKEGLLQVKEIVKKDGCIIVISFHSLEDRIVKNTFREWELSGFGEILTKKPLVPTEDEIAENPRSRSAKMRIFKVESRI